MPVTFSVATDIKDILVAGSIGTFGDNLFVSKEPLDGGLCVTIYPYGGQAPNPKFRLDMPSVQIRVRGDVNGYVAAEQKMQAIKNLLLGCSRQTVNSNVYIGIIQINETAFLKYDERERPIFISNWKVMVQPGITDNRIALG